MSNDMKNEHDTQHKLTKAYQDASDETTSSELDESIMAFAQQELESRQQLSQKSHWWSRLKLPVSMAAALVVTVGIARFMVELGYYKPAMTTEHAQKLASRSVEVVELQDDSFAESDMVAAAPAKKERFNQRQALESQEHELQELAVVGARVQREQAQRSKQEQQAEREMALMSKSVETEKKLMIQQDLVLIEEAPAVKPHANLEQPMPKQVANTGSRELLDTPYLPAQEWLNQIKVLLESGNQEEVKKQWQKFKKIYPDFPIEKPIKQRLEQILN